MRLFRILALTAVLAFAGTACADLEVTNLNDPDIERAITTPQDVETLISGSFYSWWRVGHRGYPGAAMSVAANAHSSSWGNWGMRDSSEEPRIAFNNDPTYSYNNQVEDPWTLSYRALAGVRDGIRAVAGADGDLGTSDDLKIKDAGGADVTSRALAFGRLVQALSLANLALIFDQAFVVDETTDLEQISLVPYGEMWNGALAKFQAAIDQAQSGSSFTIPASWVGGKADWTRDDFIGFAKAFRARYRTQIPRTPAENQAVDWNAVLTDLGGGLPFDFGGVYEGSTGWWDRQKLHTAGIPGWARIDYRTVGPADASGNWETWINAAPDDKEPFNIDTDDTRVTGGAYDADGSLFDFIGNSPFPRDRGIWHYSHYIDTRWNYLWKGGYLGEYVDFTDKTVDFLRGEAWYRTGQEDKTMEIVNKYRVNGNLPEFTSTSQVAPGGDRCVPQMPDGSCGDLFEAFKYEKRIELFHYGFAEEFTDDRGWGDLVDRTWVHLPVPGSELLLLLMDIYTFGGDAGTGAGVASRGIDFLNDFSPEAIHQKRVALEKWDRMTEQPIEPGITH